MRSLVTIYRKKPLLRDAIQQIRKPLDFCARHDFVNIGRVRDLEKTVSGWTRQVGALEISSRQQHVVSRFRELFREYDSKATSEKISVIHSAFHLLQLLVHDPDVANKEDSPATSEARKRAHASQTFDEDKASALNNHQDAQPRFPETSEGEGRLMTKDPASIASHDLSQLIQYAKGVGPKRAKLLRRLGIETIQDALFLFPRRYEDRRRIEKISKLRPGSQLTTVYGMVKKSGVTVTPKQHAKIFELTIGDETGTFTAKWFNQQYLRKIFTQGMQIVLSGKINMNRYGRLEMIQPEYEILDASDSEEELLHTGRIVPIYPLTEGLYQKDMRKFMKRLVDRYAASVNESLPVKIQEKYRLLSLNDALRQIHFPLQTEEITALNQEKSPSQQRLIFDEFFLLELGMGLKRHHIKSYEQGMTFQFQGEFEEYLRKSLPFALTAAQNRVIQEIQKNMRSSYPMNRLLQGDVGSGKTLVALIALLSVIEAGYQGAIMVPTEILAEQHERKISTYLEQLSSQLKHRSLPKPTDGESADETETLHMQAELYGSPHVPQIATCLLSGSLKKRERENRLLQIQRGEIQLVIGTHALIQHDVKFHNLGLIVIDEQHKFGVMQRATLKAKGYNPDVLIMTATPIPRTLSLTVYGDLDVSLLDELPPGRTPVITRRFYDKNRERAYRQIEQEITQGRQVYIVCPLVEESEKLDLKAATEMSEHLASEVFPQFRIGLVHGRMKAQEKDRAMLAFKAHEIDILVSTTVLEVGIDVPNATVMLIEHAERFGLSQLHQLRGRVGRGSRRSYCLLMTSYPMSNEARRRLDAMVETTDGFVIAERDLEIRGPGEFFGTKQSGLPDLHIANLIRDVKLLEYAREEAFNLIKHDPDFTRPEHQVVKHALEHRWKTSLDLISIG